MKSNVACMNYDTIILVIESCAPVQNICIFKLNLRMGYMIYEIISFGRGSFDASHLCFPNILINTLEIQTKYIEVFRYFYVLTKTITHMHCASASHVHSTLVQVLSCVIITMLKLCAPVIFLYFQLFLL